VTGPPEDVQAHRRVRGSPASRSASSIAL
jgi:hypothetical protein